MAGELQPLDEKFAIVGEDGRPTPYFIKWAQTRQIDINESTDEAQVLEILIAYLAAHPMTVDWGEIGGSLPAQTDLQAVLDTKLPYYVATGDWDGYLTVEAEKGLTIFNTVTGAFSGFFVQDNVGSFYLQNVDGSAWLSFGGNLLSSGRFFLGASNPIEFDQTPYVINDAIYHEGNLSFGTGLDYTAGVLTATGGGGSGGVLPVVDGSIPPVFLQNPDGSLIYAPI